MEEKLFGLSVDDFYHTYEEKAIREGGTGQKRVWTSLSNLYEFSTDPNKRMLVFYATKTLQNKKNISSELVSLFADQAKTCEEAILIIDHPLSSKGNTILEGLRSAVVRWQVFFDSELTFNATKHVNVPRHELLSPQEAETTLRAMRTTPTQVPIIKLNDPIIKYYGWPIGGLVRIYRDDSFISVLAPESINYRIIFG